MNKYFISDMNVMLGRSMRHIFRSLDTIITVTIMPIMFMLLFVYVFGGAIQTGTDNYVNYLLPGILLMAIAGLSATSVDGAGAFAYPLIFLPFISSAFVPTETMPPAVRAFAEHQPVTAIVDAIRSLLSGQPVGNNIWIALAWCVGITLVAYVFAMRAYKKRV